MARGQGGTLGGFKPLSTPNAPTDLSVSAGIGSASVSFTAPENTGDAAIDSYIVTAINESTGVSTGATGTESPINISPGAGTFKFRAQAVNAYGPGRLTEFQTGQSIFAGASMWSWGESRSGWLGINLVEDRSSPTQIGALTTWKTMSAGSPVAFGIKTDGTLWSWGYSTFGGLGNGDQFTNKSSPIQIGALTNWSIVDGGLTKGGAIKTDGTRWAWGINGGALGDGYSTTRDSPVQIGALTSWCQISLNYTFSGAVRTNNTLWMNGVNNNGQLGDGTTVTRSSPVQVGSLTNWKQVSVTTTSTFAVKTDGTLWAWGANTGCRLGDGTCIPRSSPVQIGSLNCWASVSTSKGNSFSFHTLAITTDGKLYAWGYNSQFGSIGNNTRFGNVYSPTQIGALTNWKQASAATYASSAVKTDGTLWMWGRNNSGNLGQNNVISRSSPTQVGSLDQWLEVSINHNSSYNMSLALYGES